MGSSSRRRGVSSISICRVLVPTLAIGLFLQTAKADGSTTAAKGSDKGLLNFPGRIRAATRREPDDSEHSDRPIPLTITNKCDSTIWPGIATQAGKGPGTGGFELTQGKSKDLWVSSDWQGRVWGRTNCTVKDDSCSCKTGDCSGMLDCESSGATPATLAEFTLAGGMNGKQTFYDISLVDGYNLPMGLNYIPAKNTTFIPPNLTNCACIASPSWIYASSETGIYYTNSTYPVPLETRVSNENARNWCPWKYLAFPPTKPGDGVYPYPDDDIQRPEFSPCNSACAAYGTDKDCCVGEYHDPNVCKPSAYSKRAKIICPDAYSFAFDDQQSTFIIPTGGGFEVIMCPKGRSTNILRQLGKEMNELAESGSLSELTQKKLTDVTYIVSEKSLGNHVLPTGLLMVSTGLATAFWLLV
ncbi:hypothetical protein HYE67_000634 [Fusarium culmorum]|uniref:Thaumatin-like protein n=1 Tax=Fusarium culmorum TaxID=5516 RepID=A0A2T4GN38_FUSCU|nr:Thaumatin-like protein [Fusarium culmorum]QPC58403.1 hypothetical protein HYE67_000634 [Fusarium culmorum]